MAQIFLSYAREDESRARLVAASLEAQGWSVWWDRRIPDGVDFNPHIQQQLDAAQCIVVLWSRAALASPFVRDEASEGLNGRLVPAAIEPVRPPLGFRALQFADLSDWDGQPSHEEFDRFVGSIRAIVPPLSAAPVAVAAVAPQREGRRSTALLVAIATIVVTLAALIVLSLRTSDHPELPGVAAPGKPPVPDALFARSPPEQWIQLIPRPSPQASNSARAAAPPTESVRPQWKTGAWGLPLEDLLGFVEIPAGPFTMGQEDSPGGDAYADELPRHQVTLPAFFIGRYEVTVGQYRACAADGGCKPANASALGGADDLPVRYVSWHEALAYCAWLERQLGSANVRVLGDALAGRRSGRAWHVTLPSEAQWEKAARGTDGRAYPWGNDPAGRDRANYSGAAREGPAPVGSYRRGASAYGLLDMSGNVWEWTRSKFQRYPYRAEDGRESIKAGDNANRVVRGGSFMSEPRLLRAAHRSLQNPNQRQDFIGFRVAVSP